MSQNRKTPPRTRPDLGRPGGTRRTPRDDRLRTSDHQQDDLFEGVTGVRPELPPTDLPLAPRAGRPAWIGILTAGAAAAACGWVALTALASLAWLTSPLGSYGAVMGTATQLWLAGHGGGLYAAGTRWTVVPSGITLLLVWLMSQVSAEVMRRLQDSDATPTPIRLLRGGLVALTYATVVGAVGLAVGQPRQAGAAFGGALLLGMVGVWWARARISRWRLGTWWPGWGHQLPRSLAVGLLALGVLGSATLVTGLVQHRGQVAVLTAALGGGAAGGLGAVLAQAAFLPTFVVWAVSYALGAGFDLGDGGLVSPSDTHLGLLPAWPVTAALPTPGPGSYLGLCWLAGGVVAGGLAAWVYLRGTHWTRPDTGTMLGGCVGLLLGLLTAGIGTMTRGDLGVARLVGLGPRPLELLVLAVTLTTCGGLVTGLGVGIARWLSARRAARASAPLEVSGTLLAPRELAGTEQAGELVAGIGVGVPDVGAGDADRDEHGDGQS
ncbi:DUF6350 family protein [Raineyella fluvialis]|uniref:Uncharacterized protein n=1 Tax=Raineyella fluvialis TaxID=2662261 RepID=A0A5Q2F798_9ACTN|nr:DUF6350 family protein [Raineyella fluvialis]QGF22528.1 hypothetical protein Rai3103_01200 [Raineyella fluvialis]